MAPEFKFNAELFTNGLTDKSFGSYSIHRVNLPDRANDDIQKLVGSKSGISVLDSKNGLVLLPPGSSAEVDFFMFEGAEGFVTHNNPNLSKLDLYPTFSNFLNAWNVKRDLEKKAGVEHGFILANLKTHGQEEIFLKACESSGLDMLEIVFLDQEPPATDRLMREMGPGKTAPLAIRTSRIESIEDVLLPLRNPKIFATPAAFFYDPNGCEKPDNFWPFEPSKVKEIYDLAPQIKFILCCPSRWGQADQIEPLAKRLKDSGIKKPIVMTDIDKIPTWEKLLNSWS